MSSRLLLRSGARSHKLKMMHYNLHCENLQLSDFEARDLDKKIERLGKHVQPPFVVDVTLQHDAHHLKGAVITCRINVTHGKKLFHVERTGSTTADAVDEVLNALKNELERDHDKRKDRHE